MKTEAQFKLMTNQLRLTNSEEDVADYIRWIIKSDIAKEYYSIQSETKVVSLVETEACEGCEKQTPIDEMEYDSGSECSFCRECYSAGIIAMYSDFALLHPKEYQNYRNAMEEGALISDLIDQKKQIESEIKKVPSKDIFQFLIDKNYQKEQGEQEYFMYFDVDMPKIINDAIKHFK